MLCRLRVIAKTRRLAMLACLSLPLTVIVGAHGLFGAQRAPEPRQAAGDDRQESPAFRSEVRLIDVDVFVTDKEGRFVRGLTRDDFELVEDGNTQAIAAFSFTDLPVGTAAITSANPAHEPEPDVTTNSTPEGRIYVLLMDAPSTAGGGGLAYDYKVKQFATQFISEAMASGDVAAVVHVNGTFSDSQGFTTSRRLLLNAIDRYALGPAGANAVLTGAEMVTRNLATYRAIQDVSERLGAMSGRRKSILWIGGQIEFDPATVQCAFARSANVECPIARAAASLLAAYRDAIGTAARNNVTINAIDPSGLTTTLGQNELRRTAALRMVAEDTGGIAVVGTNNIAPQFQAIVRDTSTYYVIGYVPSTPHRDGKFHKIRVRVKRPGLTVRARKGYYAPSPDTVVSLSAPLPDGVSAAARDALRMPISVRGLLIDLFTAAFKGPGTDASVVIGGQITGDLQLASTDQMALSYQVFSLEGHVRAGEYQVFTLDLKPDHRADVKETGLRFVDRIALPPGRYELRFVADQPGGSIGSLVTTFEVPAFDAALSLSGVLLGASSTAGHLTLHEDFALREALGSDPTAVRRFVQGDVVTAFTEAYVKAEAAADGVTVTGTLTTAGGEQMKQEIGVVLPRDVAEPDMRARLGATIELSLSDVPPGRYVLTVEARSVRGNARAQRRIPFRVSE